MRAKSWTIHLRAISGIANSWDAMSFAGALRAIALMLILKELILILEPTS